MPKPHTDAEIYHFITGDFQCAWDALSGKTLEEARNRGNFLFAVDQTVICTLIISPSCSNSICVGGPTMPATDLWPDFQTPDTINSPVFLLKEQAAKLQHKTKGLVMAGLRPASAPDGSFWVGFDLYSPALGEYTFRLLEVTYPPEFFPITLTSAEGAQTAHNLKQFKTLLESILRSPRTKQVVEAIMAQATALGPVGTDE